MYQGALSSLPYRFSLNPASMRLVLRGAGDSAKVTQWEKVDGLCLQGPEDSFPHWRGVSSGLPSPHAASLCRPGCGREFLRKWNTNFTFICILFMCKNNFKVATNLQWPLPWGPSDLQVEGDIKIYSLWIFCDKLNNLETLGLHCLL